jgi:hypothetical protein
VRAATRNLSGARWSSWRPREHRSARPPARRAGILFGATVAAVPLLVGLLPSGSSAASSAATATGTATPTPTAVIAPNVLLQNQQVVTVGWAAFPPTSTTINPFTQFHNDDIAILECTADPPDGHWYFFRDCYTQGENLGGNIVAPSAGIQQLEIPLNGSTNGSGEGSYPFQVQEGTLHTGEVQFPCGTTFLAPQCNNPYDIECDNTHACVLKVVALPNGAPPIPNELWQGPPTPAQVEACNGTPLSCSYTQLLDQAPIVPLDFGPIPACPPITTGNLAIEGAASSSYALESWAAALCGGAHAVTVSYADVAEDTAKTDILAGNTTVAVAAIPPTAAALKAAGGPSYLAAPLDAAGVSIVFNMVDPLTGLPIGCSANEPPSQCAAPVRLTPRLVTMLITNSATLNAQQPFGHLASGSPKRFIEPLTNDPEFLALNPGFQPPALCAGSGRHVRCTDNVEEPVLRAEETDDTFILTQWIADDLDAQRFLAGEDPCGAKLNQDWTGVTYPATKFVQLAQTSSGTTPDSDSYFPETGTPAVLQSLLYGVPVGGPPASPGSPKNWLPVPTSNYAFFGVMDTVSARRSGLPSAQLIAADPTASELARFVSEPSPGTCTPDAAPSTAGFVADDTAGLSEAYGVMSAGPGGTLVSPVETTDAHAYPLAKVDYAFVPSTGLSVAAANLVSSLLRFTAGPGQTAQFLPPGYTPLPTALDALTLSVAGKVVAAATPSGPTKKPIPPPRPPTTTPAPSLPGGPVSIPPVTSAAAPPLTVAVAPAAAPVDHAGAVAVPASGGVPVAVTRSRQVTLREGPVILGALSLRSGGWLVSTVAGLAGGSALAGGALRLRLRLRLRRGRRGA